MNNFSEKDIASIEQLVERGFLRNQKGLEYLKTQVSIATNDQSLKSENTNGSQTWIHSNEVDQVTTLASENNVNTAFKGQSLDKTDNMNEVKNLSEGSIYHEGFVYKKDRGFISSWEKRYLVLTNAKLFFFQNDLKSCLFGCVYIKYLPVSLVQDDSSFQLSLNDQGQTIHLKGQSQMQDKLWPKKINDVIEFCKSQKKVQIKRFNRSIYQQKDFTLEEKFLQEAETGDLLLISSDNSASYLQKFLTHSEFNHVSMIFRYKNEIKIFQANEQDGVSMYDWEQYVRIFKDHRRFAWRRLSYDNKQGVEQKIKQIAKKYMGRSYNISARKLIRRTSDQINDQQDRQFFCSQIVAKIYKTINLLDKQVSSVRYWPITFTSRGQLNLLNGACLSIQKNILLSKHLKL